MSEMQKLNLMWFVSPAQSYPSFQQKWNDSDEQNTAVIKYCSGDGEMKLEKNNDAFLHII